MLHNLDKFKITKKKMMCHNKTTSTATHRPRKKLNPKETYTVQKKP